jgi:hypothetical protein
MGRESKVQIRVKHHAGSGCTWCSRQRGKENRRLLPHHEDVSTYLLSHTMTDPGFNGLQGRREEDI